MAVAKTAIKEGLAQVNQTVDLALLIDTLFWEPKYLPFHRKQEVVT